MTSFASPLFLDGSPESESAFREAVQAAQETILFCFANLDRPYSGESPLVLSELAKGMNRTFATGEALDAVIQQVGQSILRHSAVVTHPACIAHLHCPPLIASVAAEVIIAATNQSMDSWDQSMSATFVEEGMISFLCDLFRYDHHADGVFTSGGTQSNLMGLLLARDAAIERHLGWNVQKQGLPPEASKLRMLCSEVAHFTVSQSAALLGLGHQAVVTVEVDSDYRMCPEALDRKLMELEEKGLIPFVLVATAGTTDFGSIDPLKSLSERARKYDMWLHVDAAYGGALKLSSLHSYKLDGIEYADSITVDFHKLFYQSISCGAFLLREKSDFKYMQLYADYLNPESEQSHTPNLVGKSLQTTRRFDALKLYMSLQHVGVERFGSIIDTTIALASNVAVSIEQDPSLELLHKPSLNAVVFRYVPHQLPASRDYEQWSDEINGHIRNTLLLDGIAVLARTKVAGKACMKFTLLNPQTTLHQLEAILEQVKGIGSHYEIEEGQKQNERCKTFS
ncbi:aspartate aminotransferase family protein [Paenibacillus sp. GSMTC-2017]|uniref:pyridoxal phosphate-dependent decarboxylase family protein n=1 Tax=Paenibacillus sp. GSMTC-2017 TaxID=2794350 RepID=UPI0018D850D9|nr:aspartate aminotransferase family protein [Paenibacillus sp. GSMTC-2017]MBH5320101.1 aspartate aminotransferase family protein [Paenibacillus sp. GSMTC-2017]